MGNRLAGKTAFVTAAGQGIGRAISEMFAEEGAKVFACDINSEGLEEVKASHGKFGLETRIVDVCDTASVNSAASDIGEIQILANVAGFVHSGSVLDCEESDWDFSFDLNVKSMHRTLRAFLPGMLKSAKSGNPGSIINMSSGASSMKGVPIRYAYGASKGAVIGLTKAVAADFITQGIRCNAICPGTVHTKSWEERVAALGEQLGGYDKAMDMFISRQPMGRVGTAEEVAALATYLASDESSFTTGTEIPIDGGWTL